MSPIRLAVVDDHALFRAGLISLLSEIPEFQVVGEAGDGTAALEMILNVQPEILLLDVNMPGMSGVEVVRELRKTGKGSAGGSAATARLPRILMLTISKSEEDLLSAIAAGADGYLLKSAEPDELRRAILLVTQGLSVLSPQVTRQVMRAAISGDVSRSVENGLSSREMEVLVCLAQGKTTTQIAGELYISDNTVKTHVRHILEKLEASNRAEAVSKAIQLGLIGGG